jgi:hypothetical protein
MMKFRKKPVVVEAFQTLTELKIATLEGIMRADPGDWIIIGVKGEQYPCKPDIFAMTYEPADKESGCRAEILSMIQTAITACETRAAASDGIERLNALEQARALRDLVGMVERREDG